MERKIEDGLAEFRAALKLDPNNPTALNDLGYYMLEAKQNPEEALGYIQRAVAARPADPNILDSLGWAYFKLSKYDQAEKYLVEASEKTKSATNFEHLGDLYDKLAKKDLALTNWRKSLALLTEPGDVARLKSKIAASAK